MNGMNIQILLLQQQCLRWEGVTHRLHIHFSSLISTVLYMTAAEFSDVSTLMLTACSCRVYIHTWEEYMFMNIATVRDGQDG